MKKKIAFIMSVVMLGTVLVGCGSSDSSSSEKAASTKASSESASGDVTSEASTEETTEEKSTEEESTEEKTTQEETTEEDTEPVEEKTEDKAAPVEGDEIFCGKWACSELEVEGQIMTDMPMLNIPLQALINAEIRSDGTMIFGTGVTGMDSVDTEKDNTVTWEKVDDHSIKIPVNDNDSSLVEVKDDFQILTFEDDVFWFSGEADGKTAIVRFKRVDEFPTYDMSAFLNEMSSAFAGLGEDKAE